MVARLRYRFATSLEGLQFLDRQFKMEGNAMKRPFPVIDADGHVIENIRQFREFLPSQFHGEDGKREYVLFPRDGWSRGR